MIVTIGNNKGGVAKTRTTLTLGAGLARRGARVLVIDFDGQRNATTCALGNFMESPDSPTVFTWLSGKSSFDDTVFFNIAGWGFDLMPGSMGLDNFADYFTGESVLKKAIENTNIEDQYDVILIDTAPAYSATLENALVASDELLLTSTVNGESVIGAKKIITIASGLKTALKPGFAIDGVLFTMAQTQYKSGKECLAAANSYMSDSVFIYKTSIRYSIAGSVASWGNQDICTVNPSNNVAKDYEDFIDEWVTRHGLPYTRPELQQKPVKGKKKEE